MVDVAIIGKGRWGLTLAEYFAADGNFQLKGVHGSASSVREVLENPGIEAVVVATPNETHYALTQSALLHGKHVLCEKPLALQAAQCRELEVLAAERGVALCTDYTHTFSWSLQKARAIISGGEFGPLAGIEMRMRQWGRFSRGNAYWLLASHLLAVLDMYVPLSRLRYARSDTFVHDGIVLSGSISFANSTLAGHMSVALNYPGKERSVALYCKEGTIVYEPLSPRPLRVAALNRLGNAPVQMKSFRHDESNTLGRVVRYFSAAIARHAKPNTRRAVRVTGVLESLNA